MYNASERKDVRKAEKEAKFQEGQRREVMVSIMSVGPGRAWIWDILISCHVFASSYTNDPYRTAFYEGERNVGLRLLNDVMGSSPDQYVQMVKEANDRHISASLRQSSGSDPDGRDQGSDHDSFDGDED